MQHEVQRSHKHEDELKRQLEISQVSSIENNVRLSKQYLDPSSSGLEEQLSSLQEQLKMSRETCNAKEDALVSCSEELAEAKLSLDHHMAMNNELQVDNNRLKERLRDYSRRHGEMDKEIVASRTSVDFNHLQLSEKDNYIEKLERVIEQFEQDKKTYEKEKFELSRAEQKNLDSLRKVHENEIRKLQNDLKNLELSSKEEMERVLEDHASEIEKMEYESNMKYEMAIKKLTLEHDNVVQQLKSEDAGEHYRIRESLNIQIHEKESEIMKLTGVIELEKSHTESQKVLNNDLKKQLEELRKSLDDTSLEKNDYHRKYETMANDLAKYSRECEDKQRIIDSLNNELHQAKDALDASRQELRVANNTISSLESQAKMYQEEVNTLKKLSYNIEETSRENERLKGVVQAYKDDIAELTAARDKALVAEQITREESVKKDEIIALSKGESERMNNKIDMLSDDLHKTQQELNVELSNVVRLEATVKEQKEAAVEMKNELETARHDLLSSEQKLSAMNFNSQSNFSDVERSCSLMIQSLIKWDQLFSEVVEGDYKSESAVSGSKSAEDIVKNHNTIFQNSIAVVERIQYKVDKMKKIREYFDGKYDRATNSIDKKFDAAQDKSSLLSYRLLNLEDRVKTIGKEVEKDQKRKEMSQMEMKSFQEVIVHERNNDLKNAQERASQLALELQSEQHRSAALERELSSLQHENSVLQSEQLDIQNTEVAVNSLSDKFKMMAESNRLISLELEERGQLISQYKQDIEDLTTEKNSLLKGVERLTSQVEMRDNIMKDHENVVASLKTEIQQLKSRQMNPDLEQSILASQDILKSSISDFNKQLQSGEDLVNGLPQDKDTMLNESTLTSVFLSDNAATSSLQTMFSRLSNFMNSANELSKKSEDLLRRFEQSSSTSSLSSEVFELLDSNSRLSSKLLQLAIDFKRLSRKVLLQSSDENESLGGDIVRNSADTSLGRQRQLSPPSRFRGDVDFGRTSRGASFGIDTLSSPFRDDSPLRPGDSAYTPLRMGDLHHRYPSSSISKAASSNLNKTPNSHIKAYTSSGVRFDRSHSNENRQQDYVPGSRLAKLGNDLENLAGKLDSFNANASNMTKIIK